MAYELVVVGASLGGLNALKVVLRGLRDGFPAAIAVVLHQGQSATSGTGALTPVLQRHCVLPVSEPEDKEPVRAGHVYVAPAGYHLLVERGSFALTEEGPVLYARPSIDVLFESAADGYRQRAVGVALTASTEDGVRGMARIKARGGLTLVQDPATAEARTLPDAVLKTVPVDRVLTLPKIAPYLALTCLLPAQGSHPARGAAAAPARRAPRPSIASGRSGPRIPRNHRERAH